jgi:hypothetical protein
VIHKTIVWAEDPYGTTPTWPATAAPDQCVTLMPTLGNTNLLWINRESLDVPLSMQSDPTLGMNLKYLAIEAHQTQVGSGDFLFRFLHKDEIFWAERPTNPDNLPPVVNAGPDQTVTAGNGVALDGSGSFDPEGVGVTYAWRQASGPSVSVANPTSAHPGFTVPAGIVFPTTLSFELLVADGMGGTVPDAVSVLVNPINPPPANVARNATATASSEDTADGQTADKAIDGVLQGWPQNPYGEWASNGQGVGAWLHLDWSTPRVVNRVALSDRPNQYDQVLAGTLSFSDGSSVAVGALDNAGAATELDFSARQITWLRFTVTQVSTTTANAGLEELQAWNVPGGL